MSYHPRIESKRYASFLTTRSRNSELWFINNPKLEIIILGYLAKYCQRYGVKLYAFAIEGNHIQLIAKFPNANRAAFMRDLNSSIARAVARHVKEYNGGSFWGRRYSQEFVPGNEDIENRFFYTVLQPVQDGLVSKISEYPGYNCFNDAIHGIEREFKVINWKRYNAAKIIDSTVAIQDYEEIVTLKYERLPGYEEMSAKDYAELMMKKLEVNRQRVISDRIARGITSFVGKEGLLKMKRGSSPKKTKKSTIKSHRPRVLSVCALRRDKCLAWYFRKYFAYKAASKKYRAGFVNTVFPAGMYRPACWYELCAPP